MSALPDGYLLTEDQAEIGQVAAHAGWRVYPQPERVMVRDNPEIYQ